MYMYLKIFFFMNVSFFLELDFFAERGISVKSHATHAAEQGISMEVAWIFARN